MILNDKQIREALPLAPFSEKLQTEGIVSYGLSSYGYDIRLSPLDFRVFRHLPGEVVDPKDFKPEFLEQAELRLGTRTVPGGFNDTYFVLPGNSYGLGVSVEKVQVPHDVLVLCVGKSTYARCGVIANLTPLEPGWEGHITLEFSNSSQSDCRIYANEGVVQLLFIKGEPCEQPYRNRKYQRQPNSVTLPRV